MKWTRLLFALLVFSLQAYTQTPAHAGQTLPIKRVVLYSNGVAYVERRGTVTGRAEINLSFKQSQVDDVLKSMVVLDLGQGRIGAVSYNSSAPPSARIAEIPFAINPHTAEGAGGGLAGVLSQLQGAKVAVTTATRTANGSILTVEERRAPAEPNKPPAYTNTLVIAAPGGELMSFDLAEVRSIKLVEEGTQRDISEFADATASARRRDAKTITVTSDGDNAREMVVSYTIAAPIWKTNYRVVLDAAGKPFFQGWAIVDNVSEEDWENVQLSLVSGSPVSFIQPIQKPFYRYRPVVPMPEDLQLTPQVYEPGQSVAGADQAPREQAYNVPPPPPAPAAKPRPLSPNDNKMRNDSRAVIGGARAGKSELASLPDEEKTVGDALASGDAGVQTAATGQEVGDLFEYRVEQPITVRRDRSALIPIVQVNMEGERASIYNESVRRDRPMGGLLLKNTTNLTLENGAVTVIDGNAYAGEALMERLKSNEQRLISFALDLGTLVTARQKQDREPTYFIKALNGVFNALYYQTDEKTYTLTNQTDKPRVVYIEHPIRQGWELSQKGVKPYNTTQRYHRFRVELAARATVEMPVTERRQLSETYEISSFKRETLEIFIQRRYIDDATRAALEKVITLNSQIVELAARVEALDDEREEIAKDQERLRENIDTLGQTAGAKPLIARYLAKVNKQETRLEQIEGEKKAAQAERERLQKQLETAVRGISLDRNLEGVGK